MSSIDIETARATWTAETEPEMLQKMAKAHGCRLIYKYANDYGNKVTPTDYKVIMNPGDAHEQGFLNSPLVHNAVLVYRDGSIVNESLTDSSPNREMTDSEIGQIRKNSPTTQKPPRSRLSAMCDGCFGGCGCAFFLMIICVVALSVAGVRYDGGQIGQVFGTLGLLFAAVGAAAGLLKSRRQSPARGSRSPAAGAGQPTDVGAELSLDTQGTQATPTSAPQNTRPLTGVTRLLAYPIVICLFTLIFITVVAALILPIVAFVEFNPSMPPSLSETLRFVLLWVALVCVGVAALWAFCWLNGRLELSRDGRRCGAKDESDLV